MDITDRIPELCRKANPRKGVADSKEKVLPHLIIRASIPYGNLAMLIAVRSESVNNDSLVFID